MSVSNSRLGHSHDMFTTAWRLSHESRATGAGPITLGVDSAPVQLLTPSAAGVVELPNGAPIGRVITIVNIGAGGIVTVRNEDDSAITGGAVAVNTTKMFIKISATAWRLLLTGGVIT